VYLPDWVDPNRATATQVAAAGGLLLEQRLNPRPYSFPTRCDPHDLDVGLAAITVHGQPGLVQRETDYVFAEWREQSGAVVVDFNLVGDYSPSDTVAFAESVLAGAPTTESPSPTAR
jgi:hypothetical protein